MKSLLPLWRLFILTWARKELTRRNPTHPDLPLIILEIHQ